MDDIFLVSSLATRYRSQSDSYKTLKSAVFSGSIVLILKRTLFPLANGINLIISNLIYQYFQINFLFCVMTSKWISCLSSISFTLESIFLQYLHSIFKMGCFIVIVIVCFDIFNYCFASIERYTYLVFKKCSKCAGCCDISSSTVYIIHFSFTVSPIFHASFKMANFFKPIELLLNQLTNITNRIDIPMKINRKTFIRRNGFQKSNTIVVRW